MKKFLIILLSLFVFLTTGLIIYAAGPGGGSSGGGFSGDGSNIDYYMYAGSYKFEDDVGVASIAWTEFLGSSLITLEFPFYSSGSRYSKLIIDPVYETIDYVRDTGTSSYAYGNGRWILDSLRYIYLPGDYHFGSHDVYNWLKANYEPFNGYSYNYFILYDTSSSYRDSFSSNPYWFIYRNSASGVSYLYKSSSPLYYDSDIGKYRYKYSSTVESYDLTADSISFLDSVNLPAGDAITANTSSLVWSSLDIYNESNVLHFTGDTYFKSIFSDFDGDGDYAGPGGGSSGGGFGGGTNSGEEDSNASWFSSILTSLKNILDSFLDLPGKLLSGFGTLLSDIFVPDDKYIETAFNSFTSELNTKFNIDTSVFESLFTDEKAVDDIYMDYSIPGVGDFNFKVFDSSFFKQGVEYFRPIIRGFLVLLLLFYHIKQLIGFFGYDAGVIAGRQEYISASKDLQRGGD